MNKKHYKVLLPEGEKVVRTKLKLKHVFSEKFGLKGLNQNETLRRYM